MLGRVGGVGGTFKMGQNTNKIILSLYDFSGKWSQPYVDAGYRVYRFDLGDFTTGETPPLFKRYAYPSGGTIWRDVRSLDRGMGDAIIGDDVGNVHGILAAPPCQCFSKAGNHIQRTENDMVRAISMVDAVFRLVWVHKPQFWCIENPPGKLTRYLGPPQFSFQPFWYGDEWSKLTFLWGEFNPLPIPQGAIKYKSGHPGYVQLNWRGRNRSETPAGFAREFFKANP
jgi:hypothetical protein